MRAGAVGQSFAGRDLERWSYERPFDLVDIPDAHYVVLAQYVTTEDGTGLVHQSPCVRREDLAVARRYGLPVVNPVLPDGTFDPDVPMIGGLFFKKADERLVADLQSRDRLFKHVPYEHSYPHCWRCHTVLIYYAQPSWYIRTTEIKDALLRENEQTTWYPDNVKWGRYGDWLHNNIDWALSRNRFWGTPLPIWVCPEGHQTCVGSVAELGALAGRDLTGLDLHRPYVDDIVVVCPVCTAEARRIPEVIDGWYDSGAMPFAQWGYPHAPGSEDAFAAAYPAQFICEAIDQTRGWFYTLMAIGTLVFDRSSYEDVVCLGHILAEDGRKMSKHLGNILEPIPLMDSHGADAVRWFMAATGSPWLPRRIGHTALQDIVRKVLLTYWNTVAFQSLYARAADWSPTDEAPPISERTALDRWALSEAHRLARDVDAAYEVYDTQRAGRLLTTYVDDLSNWYVRRSRRRFWRGDPAALATLHECLRILTLVMAPLTPFVTERVWRDLFASTSFVEAGTPSPCTLPRGRRSDEAVIDDRLATDVALVRRLVELGRSARAESRIPTRQPLGRALVGAAGWAELPEDLKAEVAEELNVASLEGLGDAGGELLDVTAKGNFRSLGKRFGQRTPIVAAAIAAADAAVLADSLRSRGTATVEVEGASIDVAPEDVVLSETPRSGWAVAADGAETVALDLTITPALRRAGLAREAVRLIQDARKSSGLDVSDRISLSWTATDTMAEALREHEALVADEVLATSITEGTAAATSDSGDQHSGDREFGDEELGLTFRLQKAER